MIPHRFIISVGTWLRNHPFSAGIALLLIILSIRFLVRNDAEFEEVYINAAWNLRSGGDMYDLSQGGYVYPPFMAWAISPVSYLPFMARRTAWWAINLVCLLVVLRGTWKLAGGGPLEGEGASWKERVAAVFGGACGVAYLENCLAHRQADVVIAAFLVLGCLTLARTKTLTGATWFGLAAAMKCTALLWAPYLLWRFRPQAAAWMIVVAIGVNYLPEVTNPSPYGRPWLAEYVARHLKPLTDQGHYAGTWVNEIIYNQSLAGAGNRWLLTSWVWGPKDCDIVSRPSSVSPAQLRKMVLVVECCLVVVVLLVCGRPFRVVEKEPDGQMRGPLEYSLVFLLMLLLSPMSSKAHFGLLILPGFLVGRAVLHRGGRWLTIAFAGALVMTLLANKDLLGSRVYTVCLWHGSVTLHALLLLTGCLILLGAKRTIAAEAAFTPKVAARAA